jgi:WD40 repeat protein
MTNMGPQYLSTNSDLPCLSRRAHPSSLLIDPSADILIHTMPVDLRNLRTLSGHTGPITGLAFHPRTSIIASSSEDGTIKIWNRETGMLERTLGGHTGAVQAVDFDSRGHLLGKHVVVVRQVILSLTGVPAASCSADPLIKLWNTLDQWQNIRTFYGHEHSVSSVCFMPDGQYIISASRDKTIKIFHVASTLASRFDQYLLSTLIAALRLP